MPKSRANERTNGRSRADPNSPKKDIRPSWSLSVCDFTLGMNRSKVRKTSALHKFVLREIELEKRDQVRFPYKLVEIWGKRGEFSGLSGMKLSFFPTSTCFQTTTSERDARFARFIAQFPLVCFYVLWGQKCTFPFNLLFSSFRNQGPSPFPDFGESLKEDKYFVQLTLNE